jgi:hypothetical protein
MVRMSDGKVKKEETGTLLNSKSSYLLQSEFSRFVIYPIRHCSGETLLCTLLFRTGPVASI